MPRTPARFTQADLARAARVARDLGHGWRARVTCDGEIIVEEGAPQAEPTLSKPVAATREFRL